MSHKCETEEEITFAKNIIQHHVYMTYAWGFSQSKYESVNVTLYGETSLLWNKKLSQFIGK